MFSMLRYLASKGSRQRDISRLVATVVVAPTNNNKQLYSTTSKWDHLKNARLNKGLAFEKQERRSLGLQGLLPAAVQDQKSQEKLVIANLNRLTQDLDKYVYLMTLLDNNERLFYKVLASNVEDIMPLVYTPVVGEACIKYSQIQIFNEPKGMWITINHKGHIYEVLKNWPVNDVKVIVVTDGERILGLGDLGANGMGIPVGKLALYTALAGVNPRQCLPITLDVGTNNETFLKDENYIGLRHKRVTGQKYDDFIEEFVEAVKRRFGPTCLIQFEDFANAHAFRLLEKYQNKACCYNDDIQGTASVALAGLLAAVRVTNVNLIDNKFLFYGAGEASIGTADLISLAMVKNGCTLEQARSRIYLIDSKGLIVKNRPEGGINSDKAPYAKDGPAMKDLGEVIDNIKPTAIIGAAAQGKKFSQEIIEKMTTYNKRPIIFALSNPTSKAECTAEEAYIHSGGKVVFASGSPFKPFEYNGKLFHTGQGNNCYIFPAIGLACVAFNIKHVTEEFFLVAAESLAGQVHADEFAEGRVYPNLNRIQDVSLKIAADVGKYAVANNLVQLDAIPAPEMFEDFLKSKVYRPDYEVNF